MILDTCISFCTLKGIIIENPNKSLLLGATYFSYTYKGKEYTNKISFREKWSWDIFEIPFKPGDVVRVVADKKRPKRSSFKDVFTKDNII